MARFSLHTVGRDRPGIIARVTGALADFGANLEESNMTILHGQSSIMLIVEAPGISDGRLIEQGLEDVADELGLFVTVCPLPEDPIEVIGDESYLISIGGTDRPGVAVPAITMTISDLGGNVIDLTSRPLAGAAPPTYRLRLSVAFPLGMSPATLEAKLGEVCRELRVPISIRPFSGEVAWDAPD